MGYEFTAFRQDLQAAVKALEEEDFENMNIYSNRIMSNSIYGTERKLALPGFYLKDISFILGNIKAKTPTSAFSTAKSLANEYAKNLSEKTSQSEFKEEELWLQFHEFMVNIRKFSLDPIEEKAYTQPNTSFTHEAFQWLISHLDKRREILLHPKNLLLKGILNEMNRLYRNHGVELAETYSMGLMTALDRCNDYVRMSSRSENEFEERVKQEILPYLDRIIPVLKERPLDFENVNQLLWELVRKWRVYFIEFMERSHMVREAVYEPEKGIELPEETRKKLTDAITKSLEGEPKPKE